MLQSHPIEEPHLDFSSWRESFNTTATTTTTTTTNNNNNNNDRGNRTSARCELDLPASWTQTFDQPLLRLDTTGSSNQFSLIDRVMGNNNNNDITLHEVTRQPHLELLRPPQLSRIDHNINDNFQQQQTAIEEDNEIANQQEDVEDMESIWERSSQKQDRHTLKALTWDDNNRLQPTPFLTELPLLISETLFQSRQPPPPSASSSTSSDNNANNNIPVVKEQQLVQNLIQTLSGNSSICFQWNDNTHEFEPRISQLRILSVSMAAMQPVIDKLLKFGTQMKRLEHLIQICKLNPSRYGLTGMAFACCLEDLHLQIQLSLKTMFSQGEWTVLEVYHHVSTLGDTLDRLARLVHLDGIVFENASPEAIKELSNVGFYIPKGNKLLEMIWNEITPLDFALSGSMAFYRDVCLGLLCHTSIPYLTMLSQWLGLSNKMILPMDDDDHDDGKDPMFHDWKDILDEAPLRDPYEEFFLYDMHKKKEFLVDRFQPKKQDELPYFLNPLQAGVVLRTGNALQLLRRFQPEHPLCCIDKKTLNQGDLMLCWMPLEAQSHRYINRLHEFAHRVRQYNENKNISNDSNNNNDNVLLANNNKSKDETESMDVEMDQEEVEQEYKVPALKALDQEIKVVSDFHKTLDTILLCHQGGQQPADDNDPDQDKFGYIPVVQTITDQSVHQPLAIWCPLVNESAMKLFTEKFHIEAHLELIRRFFLFGDESFSNAIKDALFINHNNNREGQGDIFVVGGIKLHHSNNKNSSGIQWPPRTSDLNMALRAVLLESIAQMPEEIKGYICKPHHQLLLDQANMEIEDLLTFGVREKQQNDPWRDPYEINALDFLYLQYRVPYPLNIIINNRTLDKYNRMFTFLLQLQRIDAITKYIYQTLPPATDKSNLLQHRIRFQIGQFATTLCQYVFDTAIHHTWYSFIHRIQDQDDKLFKTMDPIMFGEYHEHVLDRMLYQCFLKQSQQPIKHMLNQILQDIIILTTTLMNQKHDDQEQAQLEQGFEQYMEHTHQFIKVLSKLHERGIGRLGNVMNSKNLQGSFGVFGDFHDKLDAKSGQGTFAQELLIRLDMNGYYINYSSTSLKN